MRMSPEAKRNIIDALNSMGYCIKFRSKDIEATTDEYIPEIDMSCLWEVASRGDKLSLYQQLLCIYTASLRLEPSDVEANFNLASVYM